MSDIDPAHIDALARVFSGDHDECGLPAWTNEYVGKRIAEVILTSPDPAVHAAMLDALTRHGVLTEEVMNKPIFRERTLDPTEVRMVGQNGDATVVYVERWADQRRLVTPWEVTE